ncbi:MAG: GGDEF domain-containing protein [Paenibacillus sp.]|nr:GGDEF domain-containing protein [Paenibacillus sp.]
MRQMFLSPSLKLSDWNRKIRIMYWLIGLLMLAATLGSWPFTVKEGLHYEHLWRYVVLQNGILFSILLMAEFIYRIEMRKQDYVVITVGSGFVAVIQGLAPIDVSGIQIVMIIPILISVLYFEYRKVLFACVSTLLPYTAIMMFNPTYRLDVPMYQKAVGYSLILFITLTCLSVVNRGLKIMISEKESLINEEKYRLQRKSNDEASSKDTLTGLNNHRCFQERLRGALDTVGNNPLHLALIDIDNFKQINDEYGHLTGDIVIRKIGELLNELSNCNCFPARYGGEEFAVIFSDLNSMQVEEWLEALRLKAQQAVISELGGHNITVSIGCHLLKANEGRDFLFRQADAALYRAKRNGKNQVAW